MNKIVNIILLIAALLLTSCAGSKLPVSDFSSAVPLTQMNGRYWGGEGYRSFKSGISKQAYDIMQFVEAVELDFDGKEHLTVKLYDTENNLVATEIFKGKIKKNYFEIIHKNKLIPVPAFFIYEKDRTRIGFDRNNKLLVHSYDDIFGWVLVLVAGTRDEYTHSPELFDEYAWSEKGYKSIRDGNKLGMADSLGNMVLQPQYDLILPPDNNGRVRVKKGTKWALCDTFGNMKTEFVYSKIRGTYKDTIYDVSQKNSSGEWNSGRIDQNGKVLFDCVYDLIYGGYNSRIWNIGKDGLYAFAMPDGRFLTPFVFRENDFKTHSMPFHKLKDRELGTEYNDVWEIDYKGKKYYLDSDGKMYLRVKKNIFTTASIDYTTWIDASTLTLD